MGRIALLAVLSCCFLGTIWGQAWESDELAPIMRRGDANNDGIVNVTDAMFINGWLFSGGVEPPCLNQADVNNDGVVNVSDSTFLLSWLFSGGLEPPSPGPYNTTCVEDDIPRPGCKIDLCL